MTKQSSRLQRKKMGRAYCRKCNREINKDSPINDKLCTCCLLNEVRKSG